jgi:hypothetical protein
MKKLVLLLIACIGFTFMQAQTVTVPTMTPGYTYLEVSTPYTLTNTVGRTFKWSMAEPWPATQDFIVHLDSLSGNHTNVLVTLWGQKSALKGDSTSIGTLNWKGSTADTTGIISNTTENRYLKYYTTFKGTGTGTTRINFQAIKLYWPD